MKYIIFQDFSGQPVPFLFPDKVAHADMRDQMPYSTVLSAGYVRLEENHFVCSGGDAELGVSATSGDEQILQMHFLSS